MPAPLYKRFGITEEEWKTTLKKMYYQDRISQAKIAEELGCYVTAIEDWFKKFGFRGRNKLEQARVRSKSGTLTPAEVEVIEGWILSDASMEIVSRVSARFTIGLKYFSPVDELEGLLPSLTLGPIWQSGTTRCFHRKTHSYRSLYDITKLWYGRGTKQVPRKFSLTSNKAYYWFIGDGYLDRIMYGRATNIGLCTDSFSEDSLKILLFELKRNGIDATTRKRSKGTKRIYINEKNMPRFFEYIGPCKDIDYEYKWRTHR